jgi:hypothetical protein
MDPMPEVFLWGSRFFLRQGVDFYVDGEAWEYREGFASAIVTPVSGSDLPPETQKKAPVSKLRPGNRFRDQNGCECTVLDARTEGARTRVRLVYETSLPSDQIVSVIS